MNDQKPQGMAYLFGLAIVLAFAVRLINLGTSPLNDFQAGWALQALQTSQGNYLHFGSQIAYIQLTSLLFNIFQSSNFVALFMPALIGSLVVLIPILLISRLGKIPALVLAFVLALDPGLVAISRQAGSPVFAVIGGILAITFLLAGKPRWAGTFLGIGLLGGESIWSGILGLSLALGLLYLVDRQAIDGLKTWVSGKPDVQNGGEELEPEHETRKLSWNNFSVRRFVLFTIGTLLGIGTLFFIRPAGFDGMASGLTTYLVGWGISSGVSFVQILVALLAYEPLLFLLGLMGAIRGWRQKEPLDQFLGLWAGLALVLALIYPDHEIDGLAWMIIPLSILAVREFMRHVGYKEYGFRNTINQAILTFAILVFVWFNLEGIANSQVTGASAIPQITAIGVALIILFAASLLVAWGWTSGIAGRGLLWGFSLFILLYSFSMTTAAGNMRSEYTSELWSRGNNLPNVKLLVNTVNELSTTHTGVTDNLDIVVVGIQSTGLEWALHQFPDTIFTSSLAVGTTPSIIITEQENEPTQTTSYRGDGFSLLQQPHWASISPDEYLSWIVYHSAPQQVQSVILWARVDLFPGGTLSTTSSQNP